jgi:hypothetical protein
MLRFVVASVAALAAGAWAAGAAPDAPALVAGLGDPSEAVRDAAAAALKGRADALPWLRRASRSPAPITVARAAKLLAPHEQARQAAAAAAIDACIRDGRIDLLTEWHQYWKPAAEDDLWPVGRRAARAGFDLFNAACPPEARAAFEQKLANDDGPVKYPGFLNGPCPDRFAAGTWTIRTDRLDRPPNDILFASVGGPARIPQRGGQYLVLGPVRTRTIDTAFVACDGDVWNETREFGGILGVRCGMAILVCRGNFTGATVVGDSVLLVDGDIDLTRTVKPKNCLIRASGEIRLDKGVKPDGCTLEARAKNPTAPYRFFELADVGLALADDEEGLVVAAVKGDTPFAAAGLIKGDLIRAIDDAPAGHSETFRRAVRRALVRQGDCLLTITRGDKTLDLPVFFPLPK